MNGTLPPSILAHAYSVRVPQSLRRNHVKRHTFLSILQKKNLEIFQLNFTPAKILDNYVTRSDGIFDILQRKVVKVY